MVVMYGKDLLAVKLILKKVKLEIENVLILISESEEK
jgi:hypothetical protein